MAAFNPNSKCQKCDYKDVSSQHEFSPHEHIKRRCKRCFYTWREDCLDGSTPNGFNSANYDKTKS